MNTHQYDNSIKKTAQLICDTMSTSFYEIRFAQCIQAFLSHPAVWSQELSKDFEKYQRWVVETLLDPEINWMTHQSTSYSLSQKIEETRELAKSSVKVPDRYDQLIKAAHQFETVGPENICLYLCQKPYISIGPTTERLNNLINALQDLNVVYKTYSHKFKQFNEDPSSVNFIDLGPFIYGFSPFAKQASETQMPPLKPEACESRALRF